MNGQNAKTLVKSDDLLIILLALKRDARIPGHKVPGAFPSTLFPATSACARWNGPSICFRAACSPWIRGCPTKCRRWKTAHSYSQSPGPHVKKRPSKKHSHSFHSKRRRSIAAPQSRAYSRQIARLKIGSSTTPTLTQRVRNGQQRGTPTRQFRARDRLVSDFGGRGCENPVLNLGVNCPLFNKAEDLTNRLGYDLLFVCTNDADHNPAGPRGNHARIRRIVLFFEFDSKEF